jgi:uncharacterized protein YjbJ (UPF0337 family)
MSSENRIEATAKNIEGKVQEFIGDVTGNPQDKAEGKAKQAEAQLRHTVENLKGDGGDANSLQNRAEATAKNIQGKVQEFVGDATGNPQDTEEGKSKQAEAKLQHSVENLKQDLK